MPTDREKLREQTRAWALVIELLCNDIKSLAFEDMDEKSWLTIAWKFSRIFVHAETIGIKLSEYILKNSLDPDWDQRENAEVLSEHAQDS